MTTLSLKMLSAVVAASSHGPQNNQLASKPRATGTRCAIVFAASTIFSFVPCCGPSPGADTLGFLSASSHSLSLRKAFVPRHGVSLVRS